MLQTSGRCVLSFVPKILVPKNIFKKVIKSKDFDIHCTQKNNGRILKSLEFNILPLFF